MYLIPLSTLDPAQASPRPSPPSEVMRPSLFLSPFLLIPAQVSYKDQLKKTAYADSKTLTEEKREALFAKMKADANVSSGTRGEGGGSRCQSSGRASILIRVGNAWAGSFDALPYLSAPPPPLYLRRWDGAWTSSTPACCPRA